MTDYTHVVMVTADKTRYAHTEFHMDMSRAREAARAYHNTGTGHVCIYRIEPDTQDLKLVRMISDE